MFIQLLGMLLIVFSLSFMDYLYFLHLSIEHESQITVLKGLEFLKTCRNG